MSQPASLSHLRTGNPSPSSRTLLTPPLSPASSEDIPFKAGPNDATSLTMKRRYNATRNRDRRRLNRACLSSTELRTSNESNNVLVARLPSHSKSLPSLVQPQPSLMLRAVPSLKLGTDHRDLSRRRWTLPSKAQATHGLANRVSVEKKPTSSSRTNRDQPSPAMITLRRASVSRTSSRKMSLTFFPPPKFERSRSGLLTAFLNTLTGNRDSSQQVVDVSSAQGDTRRASLVSIKIGGPETPRKASAPTVFTKVSGMRPNLLQPVQTADNPAVRRCSTKFISTGSVYEVIWDENISSSASEASPPATAVGDRRRSLAIDKLETQLFKAVAQSRRESLGGERRPSTPERSNSLASLIASRVSWSEVGLPSLSHSSSRRRRSREQRLHDYDTAPANADDPPFDNLEFFPPLRSRASTGASQHSANATPVLSTHEPSSPAWPYSPAWEARSGITQAHVSGSMIGISTHMRRAEGAGDWTRRAGNHLLGTKLSTGRRASLKYTSIVEAAQDETTPLLRPLRMN